MKARTLIYLLCLFCFFHLQAGEKIASDLQASDFELLLGKTTPFWKKMAPSDLKEVDFYKKLYLRHAALLKKRGSGQAKIPKVIHFIWLGPKEFPKTSIKNVQSWLKNHPDWVLKFWTDRVDRPCPIQEMQKHLISELALPMIGRFVDQTDNWGEKSDLLRCEILFKEGGAYVDHDVECLASFDTLHEEFDFYACLEPPHRNTGVSSRVFPCNGLFGTRSEHPILKSTMEFIQNRWEKVGRQFPGNDPKSQFARVINRTFHSFALGTRASIDQKGNTDIILPASYFYPARIIDEQIFSRLQSKGLIMATHQFAATWFEPSPEDPTLQKAKEHQKSITALLRQVDHLTIFSLINLLITLCLILVYLRRKNANT